MIIFCNKFNWQYEFPFELDPTKFKIVRLFDFVFSFVLKRKIELFFLIIFVLSLNQISSRFGRVLYRYLNLNRSSQNKKPREGSKSKIDFSSYLEKTKFYQNPYSVFRYKSNFVQIYSTSFSISIILALFIIQ